SSITAISAAGIRGHAMSRISRCSKDGGIGDIDDATGCAVTPVAALDLDRRNAYHEIEGCAAIPASATPGAANKGAAWGIDRCIVDVVHGAAWRVTIVGVGVSDDIGAVVAGRAVVIDHDLCMNDASGKRNEPSQRRRAKQERQMARQNALVRAARDFSCRRDSSI
ncbi:hypothetical protein, partial [Mesorhizobium sp.]|uniref:hypothetical protein n=1 Tax=Mesorhizobium sp. TaxID=1871066 RepID=UPI0025F53957